MVAYTLMFRISLEIVSVYFWIILDIETFEAKCSVTYKTFYDLAVKISDGYLSFISMFYSIN